MRQFFRQYEGKTWTAYDTDAALSEIFKYYGQLDRVRESVKLASGEGKTDDLAGYLGITQSSLVPPGPVRIK